MEPLSMLATFISRSGEKGAQNSSVAGFPAHDVGADQIGQLSKQASREVDDKSTR